VEEAITGAVDGAKAVPGRLGNQARQGAEAAAKTGARRKGAADEIAALPGRMASATQKQVDAAVVQLSGVLRTRLDQAVRDTLAIPQKFAETLARLPAVVLEAIVAAVQRQADELTKVPEQLGMELQRIADEAAQSAQQAVVARGEATVDSIGRAPGAAAAWVQAGTEARLREAAEDTNRLVEEIKGTPSALGSAAQRAAGRLGQAANDQVTGKIKEVRELPTRAQEEAQRAAERLGEAANEQVTGTIRKVTELPTRAQQQAAGMASDMIRNVKSPF